MQAQAHPVGRPPSASPPVLLEPDCVPTSMREREDETGYACTTCNGGGGRQSWECGVAATTSYLLPVHGTFYKTLQHLAAAAEAAVSTPDTESEPRIKARRIADISSRRGVPCATVECGCSVILFSCRRHVASARNHCTRKATQLCKDINHCKLQSTVSTTPQRCHATPLPRHDRRRLESPPSALRLLNIECAQIESTAHVRSKLESSLPGIIMYPRRKKKKNTISLEAGGDGLLRFATKHEPRTNAAYGKQPTHDTFCIFTFHATPSLNTRCYRNTFKHSLYTKYCRYTSRTRVHVQLSHRPSTATLSLPQTTVY